MYPKSPLHKLPVVLCLLSGISCACFGQLPGATSPLQSPSAVSQTATYPNAPANSDDQQLRNIQPLPAATSRTAPTIQTSDDGGLSSTTAADRRSAEESEQPASTSARPYRQPDTRYTNVPTQFQKTAADTFGAVPPIFGVSFFQDPSGFAAQLDAQVPANYVLAPGDQVLLRMWGAITMDEHLTVDRSGNIYIPQVGNVGVTGVPFSALDLKVRSAVDRVFHNYNLSVDLGHLRSVQIFVTGAAARPGSYTVGSFSTLINALFASGGPSAEGSFRHIQLRRGGELITELDLYQFLRYGDKSKDVRLLAGDVIFIPPVGEQVAVGGSVKVPAVYELLGGETVDAVLSLAGGFTNTAASTPLTIERSVPGDKREVLRITRSDEAAAPARNGDILFAADMPPAYSNTVSLRGNVLQPGQFAWHPGLKLTDLIPDPAALLTRDYWTNRNRLINRPDFQPLVSARRTTESAGTGVLSDLQASTSTQLSGRDSVDTGTGRAVKVTVPAPPIDWSYAVIERLDPDTLQYRLIPFNLGKLVLDHDLTQNKDLQPNDVVTIFSQADIHVPQTQQVRYVRVEGEVEMAGVYAVANGDTLRDLVTHAGGLTPNAYLFGAQFTRESARAEQQQRLGEYIDRLTAELQHSLINVSLNSTSGAAASSSLPALEVELIRRLQSQKATGRVVFDTFPNSTTIADLPALSLEDGDVLNIPSRPATVLVIGAVNNQSSYLYAQGNKVDYYLRLAGGPNRAGDPKHAFIIRASGSVVSADQPRRFKFLRLAPGDTVVVPEKAFSISLFRTIFDSSLTSQLALAAAAIAAFRN